MTIHVDSRAVALTTAPAVYAKNGAVYASSRDVAAFFGKSHKHVLDSIKALLEQAPSCEPNFRPASVKVAMPRGGFRDEPAYEMTRDGFTLLAMGFTGKTALAFKVRYIEEFNRMEAQLKAPVQPALPDFRDPAAAAIAWAEQYRAAEAAKALAHERGEELKEAAPKVEFYDVFVGAEELSTSSQVASQFGVPVRRFHEVLHERGIIKPARSRGARSAQGWMLSDKYLRAGIAETKQRQYAGSVSYQVKWTAAGIAWLAKKFRSAPVFNRAA